jgi:hypothetical protein
MRIKLMPKNIDKLVSLKLVCFNPYVLGIGNLFTASKVTKKLYGNL